MSAAASSLVALAPGKVNLALFLGPAREDGLHELVSLVQAVSLADELTLAPAPGGAAADEVVCAGVEGENLAARALAAYRAAEGWDAPPQRLTIDKRIPVAAGMGGGSSDAATALRLANHAAGRGADVTGLAELAFGLGSDVPALLQPGLVLLAGAGEETTILPDPAAFGVLVVPHPEPLSTPEVFAKADELGLARTREELTDLRERLAVALEGGELPDDPELLHNDLQDAALALRPGVRDALDAIAGTGAAHALVAGSGPTAFGLFPGPEGPAQAAAAAAALAAEHPGAAAAVPADAAFAGVREPDPEPAA
jgi:4-diphosphocytidyl-2-C-methyl-D-erythritol kinase